MGFLAPHADKIYALFRIMSGLLFAQHGFQKILGWFGGIPAGMMPDALRYSAGGIELIGGLLVAIGLFTGPAAFISSGTMMVAYVLGHVARDPNHSVIPILNNGELAVAYCWAFFLIAARGSGIWSVDAARSGK
jgi:putative oxidoreductase